MRKIIGVVVTIMKRAASTLHNMRVHMDQPTAATLTGGTEDEVHFVDVDLNRFPYIVVRLIVGALRNICLTGLLIDEDTGKRSWRRENCVGRVPRTVVMLANPSYSKHTPNKRSGSSYSDFRFDVLKGIAERCGGLHDVEQSPVAVKVLCEGELHFVINDRDLGSARDAYQAGGVIAW